MKKMSAELIAILGMWMSVLMLGWLAFANLDAKIDALDASLSDDIQRVENKVDAVREDLAELTGYVRGLHKLDLAEGDR